jgi:hypothetical protein
MDEEIADVARKEFGTFVKWFNEKLGIYPIIIGGWAVNHYNDYYGSKDIDVVFTGTRAVYERPLNLFLVSNGYGLFKQELFVETFKKTVNIGGRNVDVDIDAADIGAQNQFHADPSKSIPYSLCLKHCMEIHDKTIVYQVPRIELLLAYKIKAYHDRNFEVSNPETAYTGLVPYFISKRDKDGSDIVALLDSRNAKAAVQFDYAYLRSLIQQYGFESEAEQVFGMISERPGSRKLYEKIDDNEREALLAAFSKRVF